MTKILFTGDFSQNPTGFGRYQLQLIQGALKQGYKIAEFAHSTYLDANQRVPWKVYPCSVHINDKHYEEYKKGPNNHYGQWRWEKCVLHFKPDIVVSPLDPWQFAFQAFSPLKPFYHLILCPTVDSTPHKPDFINIYNQADTLLTYSAWGKAVLESYGLNVVRNIPFGINTNVYKPIKNKPLHKMVNFLPKDSKIVGFVARNNPRKRFPELFQAFKLALKESNDNLILYLHTTHPEPSWDIPQLLLENNIQNNVYFTYKCLESKKWFPSLYKGTRILSPYTNRLTGGFLNLHNAVTPKELVEIYNCFDLYVQCASNEGFGIPLLEAAACNIPVIGTDYSAIKELTEDFGGVVLPTLKYRDQTGMNCDRSAINPKLLAKEMLHCAPSVNNSEIIEKKYSQDRFTEAWDEVIRSAIQRPALPWNIPQRKITGTNIDRNFSNSEIISIINEQFDSAWGFSQLKKLKDMNFGRIVDRKTMSSYNLGNVIQECNKKVENFKNCEEIRAGIKRLEIEDWMK